MTFQAPLDPTVNDTASLDYVRHAYHALGADRLAAIALGNEPDAYSSQFNVNYTVQDYVSASLKLEKRITKALPALAGERIFEVLELSEGGSNATNFTM